MKKIISIVILLCLLVSACACSSQMSELSGPNTDVSQSDIASQTVTGRITEINGSSLTLQLGELSVFAAGQNGDQNGQPPIMPGDQNSNQNGQPSAKPDDENGNQNGQPPAKPYGENDNQNSQPPAKPDGENGNPNGQPPAMPGDQNGNQNGQPPAKPDGENGNPNGQPPAMPGDHNGNQNGQPPAMPGDQNGNQNGIPPAKPDGENGSQNGNQNGMPPAIPDDSQEGEESIVVPIITDNNDETGGEMQSDNAPGAGQMFIESGSSVTVDLSRAQILSGSETISLDGLKVGDIITVSYDSEGNAVSASVVDLNSIAQGLGGAPGNGGFGGSGTVTQGDAANTITENGTCSDSSYSSTGDDENALRIDGATVTLDGILVEKSAGATSNTENGDFYGVNAALLATNGANVTITGATVNSSAQNGNGVFSYGSGTVVNISDSVITTTKDNSGGIQTTGGGTTNASDLTVNTAGNSSAAIRSDRGGGTVHVSGGSYSSTGYNSPAVYSTADINVRDAVLTASNSEALVIEGRNSITLENCRVTGNMSSDKGSSSDENVHNVMIYQSMSGDADVGTAVFNMTGGTLTSNNGDVIFVTNTHSIITLSGVAINNNGGGYLLNVRGNSASRGWGKAGSNGAQVEFTAKAQNLNGDIVVDTISTLDMTLLGGSVFTGTVNIVDNAQGGTAVANNAVITVESGSIWNLTGNCTVTSIVNNGTINYNGYTITLADGTVLR